MFDIGFFELLLIAVVSILVLGPEQLPQIFRKLAHWREQFQRGFNNVKSQIEEEFGLDEIKSELRKEAIQEDFEKVKSQLTVLDQKCESNQVDLIESFIKFEEKTDPRDSNSR